MKCECGFRFAGSGEFRNCQAFILDGNSGVICPKCGKKYVNKGGKWHEVKDAPE